MLLHELGRDKWTVLAIARSETECELLDVLGEPDANDLGRRMLILLRQDLPAHGPVHNEDISKHLDDGISGLLENYAAGLRRPRSPRHGDCAATICSPGAGASCESFLQADGSIMTTKWGKLIADAERSPAYWAEGAWLRFTEELLSLMNAQNVTRAELARRIGVSPAYITKVFRGTVNLTLETMSRLALAVGASIRLHVAPNDQLTRWHDVPVATERREAIRPKRASSGHR